MGAFSITHLLIFLAIVIILFGTSKLKSIGSDLGSAIKNFRKGLSEGEDSDKNNQYSTKAKEQLKKDNQNNQDN